MGTRTVRLDDEANRTLDRLCSLTGLSVSEVLKRGLSVYEAQALEQVERKPYDIYRELDLGDGGYAIAPAWDAKAAIGNVIRRKHNR